MAKGIKKEDPLKMLIKHFLMTRYDLAIGVKGIEQGNTVGGVVILSIRMEKMASGQGELMKIPKYDQLISECVKELDAEMEKGKKEAEKNMFAESMPRKTYMG